MDGSTCFRGIFVVTNDSVPLVQGLVRVDPRRRPSKCLSRGHLEQRLFPLACGPGAD